MILVVVDTKFGVINWHEYLNQSSLIEHCVIAVEIMLSVPGLSRYSIQHPNRLCVGDFEGFYSVSFSITFGYDIGTFHNDFLLKKGHLMYSKLNTRRWPLKGKRIPSLSSAIRAHCGLHVHIISIISAPFGKLAQRTIILPSGKTSVKYGAAIHNVQIKASRVSSLAKISFSQFDFGRDFSD